MIAIDGSEGEGGGQGLRASLALSLVTGAGKRLEPPSYSEDFDPLFSVRMEGQGGFAVEG